ncbi:hypothetical protein GCM10010191_54810 [Actinomadura vinacea]|uniref:Translation elongation factor EFG/EF2 domain-containing protein n=1 Tax=Actinomadura vinacea TaxID=115336 RepID=A0ABN3JL46_9ACTN
MQTPLFPRPVRGVRAIYRKNIGACGPFADITVDFEPNPDGFEFVTLVGEDELEASYAEAAREGIRQELAGRTDVRVTLTAARVHEVDSNEIGFEQAGRLAVRQAVAALGSDG